MASRTCSLRTSGSDLRIYDSLFAIAAHVSEGVYAEMPHEPAPPEPRWRMPQRAMLVRGTGLAGMAIGAGWLGFGLAQRSWLFAPASLALGVVSLLAAWAAAIHLTGGEKFDDHPFV